MTVPALAEILEQVRAVVELRERRSSVEELEHRAGQIRRRPFRASLQQVPFAILAEIKRASPSAGPLRPDLDPSELARTYEQAGARAISVLTCAPFFQGHPRDLTAVRAATSLPVLCKDFLLNRFQVLEAAAFGADAVLLIAAALTDPELAALTAFARELGLEVLHEAHDEEELSRILRVQPTLLGVNSRNLKTMEVAPASALALGSRIPATAHGIFESGVRDPEALARAHAHGYSAALVGEALMRAPDPAAPLRRLTTWSPLS